MDGYSPGAQRAKRAGHPAILQEESFLVRYRRIASGASGKDCYEILVPSGEAGEAQQLLIENNLLR